MSRDVTDDVGHSVW